MSFDAVILAGGKRSKLDSAVPNKNFIIIKDRPLFIHVLVALLKVPMVGKIFIVGPKSEIENELLKLSPDELPPGRVFALQESRNIVNNVLNAFWESVGGIRVSGKDVGKEIMEKPILVIGGDSPLVSPPEVEQFLTRCDTTNYDYFMGMTPRSDMKYYYPTPDRTGIRFAYAHFSENLLRINNIHLVKPLKVKNRQEFLAMYRVRHLLELVDVIKCGWALATRHIKPGDWIDWIKMILAMFLRQAGFPTVADFLRRNIPMKRGEKVADSLLGTRSKIVITTFGGAALDVDKKSSLIAIRDNFDDWKERQAQIAQEKKAGNISF
ncbi:MAG: NTP transferase domain-containing protein [Nitrospinota bacterium]